MASIRIATPVDLIIVNRKMRVLLGRCSDSDDTCLGEWCIPGGGIEQGETVEEALVREIHEELDCKIDSMHYFKSFYVVVNQTLHVRAMYFIGTIRGKPKPSQELVELRWFSKNDLDNLKLAYNQCEVLCEFFNQKEKQ